jgi:hypothetical protein
MCQVIAIKLRKLDDDDNDSRVEMNVDKKHFSGRTKKLLADQFALAIFFIPSVLSKGPEKERTMLLNRSHPLL